MDPAGNIAVLHEFTGLDGAYPRSVLIQGVDGNLYGTAYTGIGPAAQGTVFQLDPSGQSFVVLHTFNGADGSEPTNDLLQAGDGRFYGTTLIGGTYGGGVVFRLTLL